MGRFLIFELLKFFLLANIFASILEISFRRGGEIEGAFLEHEPHTIFQL
jgi:hypothetical protein